MCYIVLPDWMHPQLKEIVATRCMVSYIFGPTATDRVELSYGKSWTCEAATAAFHEDMWQQAAEMLSPGESHMFLSISYFIIFHPYWIKG